MEVRLNKYLKDMGIASRRKADEFIEKGYITVNGEVVTELGKKIDTEVDKVDIKKELMEEKENYVYILLNKPKGYVTSKNKDEGKSVYELLPEIDKLAYAGRLDKESEGLLIFSNDGEFIFSITYPEFEKEKEYFVTVDSRFTEEMADKMRNGMEIDGKITKPAIVQKISENSFNIILTEGLNRQIRKMCKKVGVNVTKLERFRIKDIYSGGLKRGQWRKLLPEEIISLKNVIKNT